MIDDLDDHVDVEDDNEASWHQSNYQGALPCVFVPLAWRHAPLIDDLDGSVDVEDDNEDLFVFRRLHIRSVCF